MEATLDKKKLAKLVAQALKEIANSSRGRVVKVTYRKLREYLEKHGVKGHPVSISLRIRNMIWDAAARLGIELKTHGGGLNVGFIVRVSDLKRIADFLDCIE